MTSPEYQAPTWVDEDDPDFVEGVSPDLGAGYLNQLSGAVEDHGQRLGTVESDVTTLQATALDQAGGDARYILQSNAAGFAPAEATATALAGKQSLDADLTALAGLDSATAGTVATDGAGWVKKTYAQLKTALALGKGDVGLSNVDNTSDAAKPISTATQTALNAKATTASLATIATSGKLADATDLTTTGAAVGGVVAVTHVTGGEADELAVHPGLVLVTGSTHGDVQAAIDAATPGDTLFLVSEFTCTTTITVNKRVMLTGPGTLNFTSGIDHGNGLLVTAPGAVLAGLRVVNANALGDGTGNANRGISIAASDVTVRGCDIEKWQYGIAVHSTGEFQNHRILSNRIVVLGAGGGAADTGSQGEDRGDGIATWGSVATITGNIVTALAGTDARIGIHAEALSGLNTVTPAHTDRMVTITGNTVTSSSDGTGKFRRGITAEQVDNVTITGNAVADATWWGIGLVDTTDCVVSANTVLYTRTASDNHGSYWNPRRCGIMVTSLGASANNKVAGNTVRATSTASGNAFLCVKNVSGQAVDTSIEGNVCAVDAGADIDFGVWGDGASTRLRVLGNTLVGFSANGVDLYACADAEVKGNLIDGVSTPASSKGVIAQADSAGIVISGNTIYRVAQAIERVNTARNMISLNMIREVTNGIEGFGCSKSVCTQNIIVVTSGTALANLTDGVNGNVVAQNVLT